MSEPGRKTRVLCVCNGGNTRSNILARMLKKNGFEALNCGSQVPELISADTLEMLCRWADIIFVAEASMVDRLPEAHRAKGDLAVTIGPDLWEDPCNPQLVAICHHRLRTWIEARGGEYVRWQNPREGEGEYA